MFYIPELYKKIIEITSKKSYPSMLGGMSQSQDLTLGTFTPAKYELMAQKGYGKCATAYACINLIVKNFAEIEWKVVDYSKGKEKKVDVLNWENNHFLEKPNEKSSGYTFREAIAGYYMIDGNSYILPITNLKGDKPVWFYTIRPSMVEPVLTTNQLEIEYYWVGQGWGRIKVPPNILFHAKTFNPLNYFVGMSPLQSSLQDIDLVNSGKAWNVSLQQNMGKPSGIITAKETLGDNEYNRLSAQVRSKFQGSRGAGNIWIGDGGLTWNQTSINPTDVDWLEGLKFSNTQIAVTMGVAPELVGITESKTYNNVKQARTAFYKENVIPMSKLIIDDLNHWLKRNGWLKETWFIEIDESSISGLEEDENDTYARLEKAPWLTDNEKRIKTGYKPDEKNELLNMTEFEKQIYLANLNKDMKVNQTTKLIESNVNSKSIYRSNHVSVVNIQSRQDKKEFNLKIEADREQLEEEYKLIIIAMLEREHKHVMSLISTAQSDYLVSVLASKAVDDMYQDWLLVIASGDKSIANEFAKETVADISASLNNIDRSMFDLTEISKNINGYFDETLGDIVRDINSTSKDRIAKLVAKGIEEEKTTAQIGKDIDDLYLISMIPNRSGVIAKTETVRSSNAGSYFTALNSPIQLNKIWTSIIDTKTRTGDFNHVHPNGQKVPVAGFFTVSGQKMRFAGDTSFGASVGNVINCRCSQYYEPSEE